MLFSINRGEGGQKENEANKKQGEWTQEEKLKIINKKHSPKNVEFFYFLSFVHGGLYEDWPLRVSHVVDLSIKIIIVVLIEDRASTASRRALTWSTSSLVTGWESYRTKVMKINRHSECMETKWHSDNIIPLMHLIPRAHIVILRAKKNNAAAICTKCK